MISNSPVSEQEICVGCGLCCDGTLFSHATLQPGERGNLPEKIEQQYVERGDREVFRLPCAYFSGQCTIYDQPRACVCGTFRCQVLRKVAAQTMPQAQAMQTVRDALRLRDDLYGSYRQIFGHDYPLHFKQLIVDVKQAAKATLPNDPLKTAIEQLRVKCVACDLLFTKTFASPKHFELFVAKPLTTS